MRVGVGLDGRLGLTFEELRLAGREAARIGFDSVWTPAGGIPDAFHVCGAWAADSPTVRTGIAVVPAARMWTPSGLAVQAATVAVRSEGRFVLGLGTGGYGPGFWASVGLPDRPIAVMRDYLRSVRALLAGETVTLDDPMYRLQQATLGAGPLPPVPLHIAALGRQMLRLAGEESDGALLNWATPQRIAQSREIVAEGARRAGRDPADVAITMYIRVCIDDDVPAARHALALQVLGYALSRPGTPSTAGYRGLFAEMGFDAALTDLEARRDGGESIDRLAAATPDEMLHAVGYFGPAGPAPAAYARLTRGLDETVVRIVTARPGLAPIVAAMEALTPGRIRDALGGADRS